MKKYLFLICIFVCGCTWTMFGLDSGYRNTYGPNEDGGCSEGCEKKYYKGYEGDEDSVYCDCRESEK